MIILCLGLPSSASTWAFNIVRALVSTRNPDTLGVFAETSAAFQQAVLPGTTDVILKAHRLDEALFRVIEASDTPTIITWRDPRDAAVSMAQRAGHDILSEIPAVQRSAACILSLLQLKRKNTLVLDYAADYMNRVETIRDIARCLQITPSAALVERLHSSLKTTALRKSLNSWSSKLVPESTFSTHVDLDTHWHKNHIGDGKSDKWKTIAKDELQLLDESLGGHASAFSGGDRPFALQWDRISWGVYDRRPVEGFDALKSHTRQAPIYLPRGWWMAELEAKSPSPNDRTFEISVTCAEKLLARRYVLPVTTRSETVRLLFEHWNPTETIYVRCSGLDDVDDMPISIPMVSFSQLSAPSQSETGLAARRVSKQVIPAG